jgi:parallel beta-helix repeat protein
VKPTAICGRRWAVLAVLAGMLAMAPESIQAGTIFISTSGNDANDGQSWVTAKKTVQAGLNAAVAGDQVWVAAGTYVERITLKNQVAVYGGFAGGETDLAQRDWAANATTLDGNNVGPVVTAPAGTTVTTRIDGFTIRNGAGAYTNGNGVSCTSSSVTISHNTITGNRTSGYGGAIYSDFASAPTIANNTISGNTADFGGGIYSVNATITGNTITGNMATSSATSGAGGVFISSGTLANNVISGNSATADGGGVNTATAAVVNNTILSNSAARNGGGVYCQNSALLIGNTIAGNSASGGGGIYCNASAPTIANTIVAFNSSGICKSGSYSPILRYNCVYGNPGYNYSGLADPTGTNGNISADPLLPDVPGGNAHIQPGSPCVDAGDNGVVQAGWTDMDGQARILGARVDMGADESDGTTWPQGPTVIRVSTTGNDANDGASWAAAKKTVQAGLNAAPMGGQVWVAAGTYVERTRLTLGVALYGGFAGGETDLSQRDPGANPTILDGNRLGSVVSIPVGMPASTRIDGFTIRNGSGTRGSGSYLCGGGIYCQSASPTISNNTITANSVTDISGGGGGGIYCSGGAATITNNIVSGNSSRSVGGGLYCSGYGGTISNNTIASNSSGSSGGGLYCSGPAIVTGNSICGNDAADRGGGVCYYGSSSSVSAIADNVIASNRVSGNGGGGIYVYSYAASPVLLANNTINRNAAPTGGGIWYEGAPTIVNTIVVFNTSGIAGGATSLLRRNCVYGNPAYNYSGMTDPTGIDGNLSVDPKMSNVPPGNVHIQPDSPCVDAGDDSVVQAGWTDVDGQPRIQGAHVDIGADESDGTVWPQQPTVIHVSPTGSDASDGSSWAAAKRTVQAGLNAAQAGGQVWVAAGTYVEKVTLAIGVGLYGGFAGDETDLAQRDWAANVTILDGNQNGSVVTVPPGATVDTRIDGFTIRNGNGTPNTVSGRDGGGIYCTSASATISNNVITANTLASGSSSGGGIYCHSNASPVISNNTIAGNTAYDNGGGVYCGTGSAAISGNTISGNGAGLEGGGLYCSSSATITGNTIRGNTAHTRVTGANGGGGIYCTGPATITGNTITGNSARQGWGGGICFSSTTGTFSNNTVSENSGTKGGGIYCAGALSITNNGITGNRANDAFGGGGGIYCDVGSAMILNNAIVANCASKGGGIYCGSSASPTIANSTIVANNGGSTGGGVYVSSSGTVKILNITLAGNVATAGGGIYCGSGITTITNTIVASNSSGIYKGASATATVGYSCVYGNTDYGYSGLTDPTGTNGNISADPKLAGLTYGNVHIQPSSPCVDAGNSSIVQAGWTDLDGAARIVGAAVDIGADESDGTVWPAGPSAIVRVSPTGDDANDGSSWGAAKRTVQAAIDTAVAAGGEVWVAAGTYPERISLHSFVYVYGGYAGHETQRDQRDWSANVSVLDGNQGGSVVTAVSIVPGVSTIDGFTIRNGTGTLVVSTQYGGGIYCYFGSPTIANNVITANNPASGQGGGIYCLSCSPLITGNTITGNTGSGVYCDYDAAATIANNTILGNSGYSGGGIQSGSATVKVVNNSISDNVAEVYGGGFYGNAALLVGNKIAHNRAVNSGAGIYGSSLSGTIANNVVVGNTVTGPSGYGGGIYCGNGSPPITGNTVVGNAASAGGGIYLSASSATITNTIVAFNSSGVCKAGSGTLTLRNNCVFGGGAYDYSGLADPTGTNGNIRVDPKMAGPAYGNVHIQPDSPCVDSGDDSVVQASWTDMDGQARTQGGHVDIGADESDGTVWPTGPNAIVRVSVQGNDANNGSSWAQAKRTVQAGIDAAAAVGGEVWVAAGVYSERISLRDFAYVYGGFAGTEAARVERDWVHNETILDGGQAGCVVAASGLGYALCAIDGFTIRNGYGTGSGSVPPGSGVYCNGASPAIANNRITGNSAGGIYCVCSWPAITNNTIDGNTAAGTASTGGGIYCGSCSPAIAGNTIRGNSASKGGGIYCSASNPRIAGNLITSNSATGTAGTGGGIYCTSSSPAITGNTITGNGASSGGGVACDSSSSPWITGNAIAGNSATVASGTAYGGGIYSVASTPTIENNRITGNRVTGAPNAYGGGIYSSSSSLTIANNMILGNQSAASNGLGGGVYCTSGSPKIANNTIVANSATLQGGAIYTSSAASTIANTIVAFNSSGIYKAGSTTPTLRYNCVYGNTSYNYSGLTNPTGTSGNVSADPRFVQMATAGPDGLWGTADDTGDLHLLPGSPCIDAGSNTDVPADTADLDGDGNTTEALPLDLAGASRFRDDPYATDTGAGTAPIVDMGAYEHRLADANGDGFVDVVDLLSVVYSFGKSVGDQGYDATCDFNHDGAVDVVDLLDLVYNFGV